MMEFDQNAPCRRILAVGFEADEAMAAHEKPQSKDKMPQGGWLNCLVPVNELRPGPPKYPKDWPTWRLLCSSSLGSILPCPGEQVATKKELHGSLQAHTSHLGIKDIIVGTLEVQ